MVNKDNSNSQVVSIDCVGCEGTKIGKNKSSQIEKTIDHNNSTHESMDMNGHDKMNSNHSTHKMKTDKDKDDSDHSSHSHEYEVKFKMWKLIVSTIILIFVLLQIIPGALPFIENSDVEYLNEWLLFGEATIIMFILGYDYIYTAFKSLKTKTLSVNLLVTISMLSSYIYSLIVLIFFKGQTFILFDATVEVAVIIYYGKYLEYYLSKRVTKDLNSLLDMYKKPVIILKEGKEVEISPHDLKKDDVVVIYPGEKIPTDGIILEGETLIDESTFTGEKIPRFRTKDDFVYGGTIVKEKIIIKAKVAIKDSIISNIVIRINEAQNAKPKSQKISDKIASYLIPSVLLIALLTLSFHLIFAATIGVSFRIFITILVVACPCSFSMITPMSILVANSSSTRKNIILNSKTTFENIGNIDIIAFDKTGTLTTGDFIISKINLSEELTKVLVSAENKINHPIAKSIVKNSQITDFIEDIDVKQIEGKGIEVNYNNQKYFIGSLTLAKRHIDFEESKELSEERAKGTVIIYFFNEKELLGNILLQDEIRPEAKRVVEELKKQHIIPYLITGDNQLNANYVASAIGIEEKNVYSEVLPEDKYKVVKELQEKGLKVIFVGDGINDSVALQQSNVGISMGSSSDIAIQSSDITIQNNDLRKILLSISFSKSTLRTVYFGFAIAILYNIIIIPLVIFQVGALGGPAGPAIGATSMALNDTMALIIALSLRRLRFKKEIS